MCLLRGIREAIELIDRINEKSENLDQPKFGEIYFIETTYTDNNRTDSKYLLTRDAFTNIEMGYKVEKATEFTMACISSGFEDESVNEL